MEIMLDEIFVNGEAPISATDVAASQRAASVLSPKAAPAPEMIPQKPKSFSIDSSLPSSSSVLSDDSVFTPASKPQMEDDVLDGRVDSDDSDKELFATPPTPSILSEVEDFPVRKRTRTAATNA